MANFKDYVIWRGDLPFERDDVNEIDVTLFAMFSLIDFDGVVDASDEGKTIEDAFADYIAAGKRVERIGLIISSDVVELFSLLAASERFKSLKLKRYENNVDARDVEQFCAITIEGKDFRIISFSGTDDTVIGWRENFNMVVDYTVPAQKSAIRYLESVVKKDKRNFITGHSKGGHLAMYSFYHSSPATQKAVTRVYSMDGTGILNEKWDSAICRRITEVVPQDAIVGRLFSHFGKYEVVLSSYKGVNQHDAFSWQIAGTKYVGSKRTKASEKVIDEIHSAISSLSQEDLKDFIDGLDKMLVTAGADTLTALDKKRSELVKAFFALPVHYRRIMFRTLFKLASVKEVRDNFLGGIIENQKMILEDEKNKSHAAKPQAK
jgi:hypothetical protein